MLTLLLSLKEQCLFQSATILNMIEYSLYDCVQQVALQLISIVQNITALYLSFFFLYTKVN